MKTFMRRCSVLILLGLVGVMVVGCKTTSDTNEPPDPGVGPVADAGITLAEGPCFGTCPIYDITVYPNEFYELNLGRFTRAPDTRETGVLPAGSFAAANQALRDARFNTLPTEITLGSPDCGDTAVSDLVTTSISEITIAGARTVNWYQGCRNAPAGPAVEAMAERLREIFGTPGRTQ